MVAGELQGATSANANPRHGHGWRQSRGVQRCAPRTRNRRVACYIRRRN